MLLFVIGKVFIWVVVIENGLLLCGEVRILVDILRLKRIILVVLLCKIIWIFLLFCLECSNFLVVSVGVLMLYWLLVMVLVSLFNYVISVVLLKLLLLVGGVISFLLNIDMWFFFRLKGCGYI